MNVVVVAPHPDDEAIGCGGSILRHADAGDRVHVVFLTSGELGLDHLEVAEAHRVREAEANAAAEVLGLAEVSFWRLADWELGNGVDGLVDRLADVVAREGAERVYAPHPGEWHPDHQAACAATLAATDRCGLSTWAVYGYEVWTPMPAFDRVEDVSEVMPRKLEAVGRYVSQLSPIDYRRGVEGLNAYRGALAARSSYAEVFSRLADREE